MWPCRGCRPQSQPPTCIAWREGAEREICCSQKWKKNTFQLPKSSPSNKATPCFVCSVLVFCFVKKIFFLETPLPPSSQPERRTEARFSWCQSEKALFVKQTKNYICSSKLTKLGLCSIICSIQCYVYFRGSFLQIFRLSGELFDGNFGLNMRVKKVYIWSRFFWLLLCVA